MIKRVINAIIKIITFRRYQFCPICNKIRKFTIWSDACEKCSSTLEYFMARLNNSTNLLRESIDYIHWASENNIKIVNQYGIEVPAEMLPIKGISDIILSSFQSIKNKYGKEYFSEDIFKEMCRDIFKEYKKRYYIQHPIHSFTNDKDVFMYYLKIQRDAYKTIIEEQNGYIYEDIDEEDTIKFSGMYKVSAPSMILIIKIDPIAYKDGINIMTYPEGTNSYNEYNEVLENKETKK